MTFLPNDVLAENERWQNAWHSLHATPSPALLAQLYERYGEPHRAYHTLEHVRACLAHFDTVRSLLRQPAHVELAIWFHDVVYDPHAADNEAQSARWAQNALLDGGASPADAQRVATLIRLTKHHAPPHDDSDAHLLLDVDLAILGAEPTAFDAYERQIRQEYAWVPWPEFVRRRAEILRGFLARPTIYRTEPFQQQLETPARQNLERSIARLSPSSPPQSV